MVRFKIYREIKNKTKSFLFYPYVGRRQGLLDTKKIAVCAYMRDVQVVSLCFYCWMLIIFLLYCCWLISTTSTAWKIYIKAFQEVIQKNHFEQQFSPLSRFLLFYILIFSGPQRTWCLLRDNSARCRNPKSI